MTTAPLAAGAGPGAAVSIVEQFWALLDKADRRYSRVRDVPLFGRQPRSEVEHAKAFQIYTQLWRLQQEHRQRLLEAGLRRWEVGEIASRIAQLYYARYLRSSVAAHLAEAFIFYEAVLDRDYFGVGCGSDAAAMVNKQLRFLARFLVASLVFSRREMVGRIAAHIKTVLDDGKKFLQESEYKEWKYLVQEMVKFLRADTPFMNMRPLRYSFVYDPPPDKLSCLNSGDTRRGLVLSDAILCSCCHNEVKFTELTLDNFRMLQFLEWEPCGSFALNNGLSFTQNEMEPSRSNLLKDMYDSGLPPNPLKTILYRPSSTHFLTVLATKCEELPSNGMLLIYLSAAGEAGPSSSYRDTSEKIRDSFRKLDIPSLSTSRTSPPEYGFEKDTHKHGNEPRLWVGSRGSEAHFIYPCDLIPFTRRPLILVIDSSSSYAFKSIHGSEKEETAAIFLSPSSRHPAATTNGESIRHQSGSQFTMFLTTPLQAFCFLIGISGMESDKGAYDKAEKLLSLSLNDWATTLETSSGLHPVWIEVLGDPLTRRLLLRFIFCRAVFGLFKLTCHQEEFLPTCLPPLPDSVRPESVVSQHCLMRLAAFFGATSQFSLTDTSAAVSGVDEAAFFRGNSDPEEDELEMIDESDLPDEQI